MYVPHPDATYTIELIDFDILDVIVVMAKFVDLTQYAAISVSEMPIRIVNGTEPIGAAAEKLKSGSEGVPANASVVDTSTGGSGMAVETAKTPVRREPGFAGILATFACLAAVLISRRMRKD